MTHRWTTSRITCDAYLLDTHSFLWFTWNNPQLSDTARKLIESSDNQPLLSIVSAWEIALKVGLGKLVLTQPATDFIQSQVDLNGFQMLPIELGHLSSLSSLPLHHRDPFDRLIIAQAQSENIPIVTADPDFKNYSVSILW